MRIVFLAGLLVLAGCNNQAAEVRRTDNQNFEVERLFTVDGCTVYRFRDAGNTRYFSSCQGSTSWTEPRGKTSTAIEVPTSVRHF